MPTRGLGCSVSRNRRLASSPLLFCSLDCVYCGRRFGVGSKIACNNGYKIKEGPWHHWEKTEGPSDAETIINWETDITEIEMGRGLKEKNQSEPDSGGVMHLKHSM
jgi:hypothetical protein